jgi:hypothetical protein
MEDSNVMDLMEATERLEAVARAWSRRRRNWRSDRWRWLPRRKSMWAALWRPWRRRARRSWSGGLLKPRRRLQSLRHRRLRSAWAEDLAVGDGDDAREAGVTLELGASGASIEAAVWTAPWGAWRSSSVLL